MASATERQLYAISGAADCEHGTARGIGTDGGANRYYRCVECGSVLVRAGGPIPTGDTDDLGTIDPRMGDLLADIDAYHDGTGSSFALDRSGTVLDRLAAAGRRLWP